MLKDILTEFSTTTGLDMTNSAERAHAITKLNRASEMIYLEKDLPGELLVLRGCITPDQLITMPHFVGELRGINETNDLLRWNITNQRPVVYSGENTWDANLRKFIDHGYTPIERAYNNAAAIKAKVAAVESPAVVVTVVGRTANSERVTETITLDATEKTLTNVFTQIYSLSKDRINVYDILFEDDDALEFAKIPNCVTEALYKLYEIKYLVGYESSTESLDVEFVFKPRLLKLFNDYDNIYPSPLYEQALLYRGLALYFLASGETEKASTHQSLYNQTMAGIYYNSGKSKEIKLDFARSSHRRVTNGPRFRHNYYRGIY